METNQIEVKIERVLDVANRWRVESPQTYNGAADMLLSIKQLRKEIDDTFDEPIAAAHLAHKKIVAAKKTHEAPVIMCETLLKNKMGIWQQAEDRKRKEAEDRAREEAQRAAEEETLRLAETLEKAGDDEGAAAVLDAPMPTPVVSVPSTVPKVQGISSRKTWKFKVEDPGKVPRQYLIPDERAIGAVVRAMGANAQIPGVRVWEESVINARSQW